LLFVLLSDGKLIICHIISLQIAIVHAYKFLKVIVFLVKRFLQICHYLATLSLKAQLRYRLLHCNAEIGLSDDILHEAILVIMYRIRVKDKSLLKQFKSICHQHIFLGNSFLVNLA
jgi:hypothetical protein